IGNLKSLRVPIRFFQAAFASIFEKFVHRHEQYARAFHVQTQIEIEFVIEKVNVAVAEHAKERAGGFEILGMNDAILHRKFGACLMGDAVSAARQNMVQNSSERPENWYGENVGVAHLHFSSGADGAAITAEAGELIRSAQHALGGLVVVVQVSQARKINLADRQTRAVTGIGPWQRDVSSPAKRSGEKIG